MKILKDFKVSFDYWYAIKLTKTEQQLCLASLIYLTFILFFFIPIKTYQFKDSQHLILGEILESEKICQTIEYDYELYTYCSNHITVNYNEKNYDFLIDSTDPLYGKYEVGGYYNFKKPFNLFFPDFNKNYIVENQMIYKIFLISNILLFLMPIILLINSIYQLEKDK